LNFIALLITGQLPSTTASIAPNLSSDLEEGEFIISTNPSLVITPSLFKLINSLAFGVTSVLDSFVFMSSFLS